MARGEAATTIDETCMEFDPDVELSDHGFYIFLGRRRSGKTTNMTHLSQHLKNAFTAQHIVISGNEQIKEIWSKLVHPFYIHDPDPAVLRKAINEQNRRVKICKQLGVRFPPEWEVVIWCDDCGPVREFMQSKEMRELASQGRNLHITLFCAVQKLKQVHCECRENVDMIFMLNTLHDATIKTLRSENASSVTPNMFHAMVVGATRNRGLCVIRGHPKTPKASDIFAFTHVNLLTKDGIRGALKPLGAPLHWETARKHYKPPIDTAEEGLAAIRTIQVPVCTKPTKEDASDTDDDDATIARQLNINGTEFTGKPYESGNIVVGFKRRAHYSSMASAA